MDQYKIENENVFHFFVLIINNKWNKNGSEKIKNINLLFIQELQI